MIDLRRKRATFHQTIRTNQRQTYKASVRKRLHISQKQQEVIHLLDDAFLFLSNCEEGKEQFWEKQFIPKQQAYKSAQDLIDLSCSRTLLIIGEYERDGQARSKISGYLFDNLSLLIPPSYIELNYLPVSFISLCLHMLQDPKTPHETKQQFVDSLLHQDTVNRCLLNYFLANWQQIALNKCSDKTVTFFYEITKYKNIFTNQIYNDIKFQYLINKVVEDLLEATRQQRMIYDGLQQSANSFIDRLWGQEDVVFGLENRRFHPSDRENKLQYTFKNATFLSYLLLLSPLPNYNIKQIKYKLTAILNYLNRNAFLINSANSKDKLTTQFCLSVLINATVDSRSTNHLQLIQNVLKNGVERQKEKENPCFEPNISNLSHIRYQQVDQQRQNLQNQSLENLVNRVKLLMLFSASDQLDTLKFQHIENWFMHQLRNPTQNIFSLQNPTLMSHLFKLLSNVLRNEATSTFNSYTFQRILNNCRTQNIFSTKIKICKLIGKNGFDQLFHHSNLKKYCLQLADLMGLLIGNLREVGEISTFVSSLMFSNETLDDQYNIEDLSDSEQNNDGTNQLMESFKSHIYCMCLRFLQKGYKYLDFKRKQKILLNLILVDYLSLQQSRKYLTEQESEKMMKNYSLKYEQYNYDDDFQQMEQSPTTSEDQVECQVQQSTWHQENPSETVYQQVQQLLKSPYYLSNFFTKSNYYSRGNESIKRNFYNQRESSISRHSHVQADVQI